MRILTSLSILILLFIGCTSAKYQERQNERDTRREAYENARRKELRQSSRNFLSTDMLGEWQFFELVVEERSRSEDILKAKAALTARRLKGLTLRFWKSGDTAYYYRIENLITKSYGTYTTASLYKENHLNSGKIVFYPISGTQIPDLLFSFTKGEHRQVVLSTGEVHTTSIRTNMLGISIKDKRMDLTLDLGMILSPNGWLYRGNIRCSFEQIE